MHLYIIYLFIFFIYFFIHIMMVLVKVEAWEGAEHRRDVPLRSADLRALLRRKRQQTRCIHTLTPSVAANNWSMQKALD